MKPGQPSFRFGRGQSGQCLPYGLQVRAGLSQAGRFDRRRIVVGLRADFDSELVERREQPLDIDRLRRRGGLRKAGYQRAQGCQSTYPLVLFLGHQSG